MPEAGTSTLDRVRRCAVWLSDRQGFRGSGFFLTAGEVVTAAHVLGAARGAVTVHWQRHELAEERRRLFPADPGGGRYHAFPDLGLVTVAGQYGQDGVPVDREAGRPVGTPMVVCGFSSHTPADGVHADSLLLEAAGPAAGYVRLRGDEVKAGFSGSMVLRLGGTGVCGVLKASRDFDDPRGGWYTPLTALAEVLPEGDALRRVFGLPSPQPEAPGRRLVEILEAVPDMDDPGFRRQLIRQVGGFLQPGSLLRVSHREQMRDHIVEIIETCRSHRDPRSAFLALTRAVEFLRPESAAALVLRQEWEQGGAAW